MKIINKIIQLYLVIFNFWMKFPEKIRFVLVGGYNTVISYGLFSLILYFINGKSPQTALFFSFLISSVHNFFTHKIYVFNTRGNYLKEYPKCLCTWSVSYFFNTILLAIFTNILKINPYIGQLMSVVIVSINTYILLKYFAFKRKNSLTPISS